MTYSTQFFQPSIAHSTMSSSSTSSSRAEKLHERRKINRLRGCEAGESWSAKREFLFMAHLFSCLCRYLSPRIFTKVRNLEDDLIWGCLANLCDALRWLG